MADRFGARRKLGLAFALSTVPTFYLAFRFTSIGGGDIGPTEFAISSAVYSVFGGLGFGLTCGVFMSLTNPIVGATQFTGYVGLRNLAVSFSTYWQGLVVDSNGYATMLVLDGIIAFLPILLIPFLMPSIVRSEKLAGSARLVNDKPA